jgi:hypothetical protein
MIISGRLLLSIIIEALIKAVTGNGRQNQRLSVNKVNMPKAEAIYSVA